MLRSLSRTLNPLILIAAVALSATGCSSDDTASSTTAAATSSPDSASADTAAPDSAAPDAVAPSVAFAPIVSAVEALGYTCTMKDAQTSAERETCSSTGAIVLQAYHWSDAAILDAEIGNEIKCATASGLGTIMMLRGDTWAVSSFSLGGSTAEKKAEIQGPLLTMQLDLGGDVVETACV